MNGSLPNRASPTLCFPGTSISAMSQCRTDPEIQGLRDQLDSSLQVFQPKVWRPLTPDIIRRPRVLCHRPGSCRSTSRKEGPIPATMMHSARSCGSAKYFPQRPNTLRVDQGDYDTLSPKIILELTSDPRPISAMATYGQMRRENRHHRPRSNVYSPDAVFFDNEQNDSSDDNDDPADDISDNDSISDLERGSEPAVDRNRKIPDLHLRPENPDDMYVPVRRSDMRRFDFDAENNSAPEFQYPCPLPEELTRLNLRHCAVNKVDWRCSNLANGVIDPGLHRVMDRLVEFEKHQHKTMKWEARRFRKIKRKNNIKGSAFRPRDKRCCPGCLQPSCVGDCPLKRSRLDCCERCHQPLCCGGECTETKYDQRARQQPREESESTQAPPPSRHCRTCQGKTNAKRINSTLLELGRPTSAYITYSKGQCSAVTHHKRTSSAECLHRIAFVGKGAESKRASNEQKKLRGRNGLIPGKCMVSNLTISLTDLSFR